MTKSHITAALLCLILVFSLTACKDDDDPTCPDGVVPSPTLANIWPHADGTTWHFDLTCEEFELPFPEEAKGDTTNPGNLPSMADLHADLQNSPPGTPYISETGVFRLEFDGDVTTDTGITAQNLDASLFFELSHDKQARTLNNTPDHLLQIIAQVRPDLREAILPYLDMAAKDAEDVSLPILLNGYAFSAEDDGYFGFGDLDTNHSWIYLPSSLETSTAFSMQLIPAITDDLWLYGQIWSQGDLVVGGRQFRDVVECMYKIDMGQQMVVDEEGNILGEFHSYIYGTIHFAPEVGPIRSQERWHTYMPTAMGGNGTLIRDYVIE